MRSTFNHSGKTYRVELNKAQAGWVARVDGKAVAVEFNSGEQLELVIDGRVHQVSWARQSPKLWLHVDGHTYELEQAAGSRAKAAAGGAEGSLRAPMPGQVVKVLAEEGAIVKAGGLLALLEAMKMEVRIQAPWDAKVTRMAVTQGQSVEKDQVLVELEPYAG